jgi:L,D-transpeptidase catalytic domain
MNMHRILILFAAVALTGCASSDPRMSDDTEYIGNGRAAVAPSLPPFDTVSYWDGNNVHGEPKIVIRLGEQRAYFHKGGELVGVATVSTGREGFGTPPGRYKVLQKNKDHASNLYGDYVDSAGNVVVRDVDVTKDRKPPGTRFRGAPMPYFMRIVGGYGMHAGFLPGYPASHGCIRMPEYMAQAFFQSAPVGTPVMVTN